MENKEKDKQNSVSFGNLKKLKGIISGTEINGLVSNISKSKLALDTFCKNLKDHENNLKKSVKKAEEQKETTAKIEPKVETTESTPKPLETKTFDKNFKKDGNSKFNNQNGNKTNFHCLLALQDKSIEYCLNQICKLNLFDLDIKYRKYLLSSKLFFHL